MKNAIAVLILSAMSISPVVAAQTIHKWVDSDGNIHFGDTVPPEYAEQVFGPQAPAVNETATGAGGNSQPASTDVSDEILRRKEEARRNETDRVLLQTYLSVEEIESVRDSRIEQLRSQDRLTQRYIDSLNRRLTSLNAQAEELSSAGDDGLPVELVDDMADTRAQIKVYEDELARSKTQQDEIGQKFAQDISRFRELKGLSPDS